MKLHLFATLSLIIASAHAMERPIKRHRSKVTAVGKVEYLQSSIKRHNQKIKQSSRSSRLEIVTKKHKMQHAKSILKKLARHRSGIKAHNQTVDLINAAPNIFVASTADMEQHYGRLCWCKEISPLYATGLCYTLPEAIAEGRPELVRILINNNASPIIPHCKDTTPVMQAFNELCDEKWLADGINLTFIEKLYRSQNREQVELKILDRIEVIKELFAGINVNEHDSLLEQHLPLIPFTLRYLVYDAVKQNPADA